MGHSSIIWNILGVGQADGEPPDSPLPSPEEEEPEMSRNEREDMEEQASASGKPASGEAEDLSAPAEGCDLEPVLAERRDGGILVLTLNRPDRLNAVSREMYAGLARELAVAEEGGSIRAILLTGAGRGFSVGADLKAHDGAEPSLEERRAYVRQGQETNRALQRSGLPVVASVNGHAVGAGLELALSADLLVVAREARLRLPETALGTFIGGGVSYTLPQRVGMARARELLLLGRFFSPDEALEMGLANEVLPAAEVRERGLALARELATRAPRSIRLLKGVLRNALHLSPDELLRREEEALLACMGTEDWREGIRAYHEKREPRFTGR
jgi:enoyl-CoA hydratase